VKIFFIVACRNEATSIGGFATGLLTQCETGDHTAIFVDNCSQDGSRQILTSAIGPSNHGIVIDESALGPGHARRRGALYALARSVEPTWLVFMDADVSISDTYVRDVAAATRTDRARVFSGRFSWEWTASAPGWLVAAVAAAGDVIPCCESLVGIVNLCGCNHIIRGDLYLELGGHTQFQNPTTGLPDAGCDWDLGLRIWANEPIERLNISVATSPRRILFDPIAFMTSRSYEGGMRELYGSPSDSERPTDLAVLIHQKRRYYVKHFLLKPLIYSPERMLGSVSALLPEVVEDIGAFARGLKTNNLATERASFIYGALEIADRQWGDLLTDFIVERFVNSAPETPLDSTADLI
jgi:glycosyltransferase involved in cell wall biosynthesis